MFSKTYVCSIPFCLAYLTLVPESIVFLENHGKPEKAEKISKKLQEKRPSAKESRALLDDKTEDGEFKYLVPPLLHLILIWAKFRNLLTRDSL